MNNYLRITVYNPTHNVTAILDSNGYFQKLWQLSSFFVKNGWKIKAVAENEHFDDGNIPRVKPDEKRLILRACMKGEIELKDGIINVLGRYYKTI